MFRKILVWCSIIFLFGALALVTYLTFSHNNFIRRSNIYNINTISLRYTLKSQDFDVCSIQRLDSLSAASNFYFTKVNATKYPLSGL